MIVRTAGPGSLQWRTLWLALFFHIIADGSSMVIEHMTPRLQIPVQPATLRQPSANLTAEADNDIHRNNTIADLDQLTTSADIGEPISTPPSFTTTVPADSNTTVCSTQDCYRIARSMAKAMNVSIDPCEDFYDYACGNWTSYNPIPDDQGSWDNFQVVALKVSKQLQDVLGKADAADLSTARNKARTFYQACLDTDRMETMGSAPLMKILQSALGGWPILQMSAFKWNSSEFNWFETIRRTKKYGFGLFLDWAGAADPQRPQGNMIHFGEGSLGMGSRKYYFTNTSEYVREAYKGLMRNVIVMLRDDSGYITPESLLEVQKEADEIYEFESFLANISRTEEDRRNLSLSLNKMTLEQFHNRCLSDSISLDQLMDYMTEIMPNATLKTLISKDLIVNIGNPDYFKRLHYTLNEYSTDTKKTRILANYIGWRLTMEFAAKMTYKLREVVEAFSQAIDGTKKEPDRVKICAAKANSVMNTAVGSLYVKNHFNESSKAKIQGLVKNMREAYTQLLGGAEWMDEATRKKALVKLESMYEYIGYADYIVNDIVRLDKEYENLEVGPDHLYNCLNVNKFGLEQNLKDLLKKNNRSLDEVLTPADVNAFYDPSHNIIAFVAGILQAPFYDPNRPEYLNYAGIGAIIGHEITHGFDDQGSLFDDQGTFSDWWSPDSRGLYTQKAAGLVRQYSLYSIANLGHINGYLTLGENIADCGGVKEAYAAYQLYTKRRGVLEPLLPGFQDYSREQMFFLGVAQGWCGSEREKTTRNSLLTASHSPKKFRVIGPLSNMLEFSQAFQCPLGSPMNPVTKAAVW